jgi:hypothetical protein
MVLFRAFRIEACQQVRPSKCATPINIRRNAVIGTLIACLSDPSNCAA